MNSIKLDESDHCLAIFSHLAYEVNYENNEKIDHKKNPPSNEVYDERIRKSLSQLKEQFPNYKNIKNVELVRAYQYSITLIDKERNTLIVAFRGTDLTWSDTIRDNIKILFGNSTSQISQKIIMNILKSYQVNFQDII